MSESEIDAASQAIKKHFLKLPCASDIVARVGQTRAFPRVPASYRVKAVSLNSGAYRFLARIVPRHVIAPHEQG